MQPRVLVVDDEESIRYTFGNFLEDEGYRVATAENFREAMEMLGEADFDLVFADIFLGDGSGIELLRGVKRTNANCPVVMVSGEPNVESATEAVRLGAFDYLYKPVRQDELQHVARMALRHKALCDENERYRTNLEAIFRSIKDAIVTVDDQMTVVEINDSAVKFCGLTRDVLGQPFNSFPIGCDGRCAKILEETLKAKAPVEIVRMQCEREGRTRFLDVTTYPLTDLHGKPSGVLMVLRDETQLVAFESGLERRHRFQHLVGKSEKMQRVYSLIEALGNVETTVLITGESGTGKELVAEALHHVGQRSQKPLVKVNCSVLPEGLLESELFGHVKGAFTGAIRDKTGRFQRADGGTIFLDEIGDLTPKVQVQLLRVIQEKTFERVGDATPIKVDVRVVAATNKSLQEKVRAGEFREDLYYRLKVVEVNLPPLRDRPDDIPLLVDHFVSKFNRKFGKEIKAVSSCVLKTLVEYSWPGNVRELEHSLEHAFVLCSQRTIKLEHLPPEFAAAVEARSQPRTDPREDGHTWLLQALKQAGGNKAKAARLLGIDRKTLYRKLGKFGLAADSI